LYVKAPFSAVLIKKGPTKQRGKKGKLFSITIIAAHFSNLCGGSRRCLWQKRGTVEKELINAKRRKKTMINDAKVYKQN
jgi:hypothetical protein